MERAIKDLCQLVDADLFEEIAVGIGHVMDAVNEMDAATRQLHEAEHYYPACVLENLAAEEAAKVLILIDAVRCPKNKSAKRVRTLGRFYDHLAKGIYAEMCNRCPVDFAEVKKLIDLERREHYLDGPSDVDWIFPNRITQRREDDLYVGYVRDDTEGDGQGERYWTYPSRLRVSGPPLIYTPAVITLVRALHQAGATTPDGLAVIAEVWRPVEVDAEMGRSELLELNCRTTEILKDSDVLASAPPKVDEDIIQNKWIFPLWSLDLRRCKVKKETLREDRRQWSPDGY